MAIEPRLPDLIARVEAARTDVNQAAGAFSHKNYDGWRRRSDQAVAKASAELTALGAVIKDNLNGPSIRLGGIRSASTMGFEGALGNWLTAARKRLEEKG